MSSSRKHHIKSLMLSIAKGLLEEEAKEQEEERSRYMEESCPPVSMPRSMQEMQIDDLKIKVQDLMGKFKKPVLRKVRMSADAMLKALLGSNTPLISTGLQQQTVS
ncbi:hypothetical protein F7725_023394 [Dissostichus mawsoni]|uniref:Troponin I, fast skeletal muscle n=1 Tax=Dissostichus mawsoni TaxID=36200 RepID=A0A7J5Z2S3_DISMA|nr:hypothetical protein F7725_023394 [Dissostichus mawsoni]